MEAGREMDALVAEKVMGIPKLEFEAFWGPEHRYSTVIGDAWKVLGKFNDLGLVVVVGSKRLIGSRKLLWYALIGMAKPLDDFDMNANILGEAEAPTAELAICRTALLAIEKRGEIERLTQ